MNIKLTALATALLISTSFAHADNTLEVTVDVEAYVATGLSTSVAAPLVFGDIVKPTGTSSPHTMTLTCAGVLSYDQATATPNGAGVGSGGANAESADGVGGNLTAQPGSFTITGEAGYGISITTSVTNEPTGVTFTPVLEMGTPATTDLTAAAIGSGGTLDFKLCGSLEVTSDAASGDNGSVNVSTAIQINYR